MPRRPKRQRPSGSESGSGDIGTAWRWEFTRAAARQMQTLRKEVQERVAALDLLVVDPTAVDTRKLSDIEGYRLRVGSYRALYEVEKDARVFVVYWVGDRKDAYR